LGKLDTRGLIAYYPFDDLEETIKVGTVIKDKSGEGNDGKFNRMESNNPADSGKEYISVRKDGIIGYALHIAKWDYVAILDSSTDEDFDFGTGDFTWSMWVKPTEDGLHNNFANQVWFGAQLGEAGCGGGTHMWLGIHSTTDLVIWQLRAAHKDRDSIHSQKGYLHQTLGTEGLANEWHHVVAVKDGHRYSNVSIYIDGKEVERYIAQEDSTKDTTSREEKIGMSEDYEFSKIDYFYLGMFPVCDGYASTFTMDEVSIWNRPLSKDEVEMLYKKQSSKLKL
jgi:hypothetical protein